MLKKITKVKNIKEKIAFIIFYLLFVGIMNFFNQPCIFTRFGIICPGCGITRAIKAFLSFDIIGAFSYHPMFWSIPIMLLYFWFDGHIFKIKYVDKIIFWIIVIGFAINWIVKLFIHVNF